MNEQRILESNKLQQHTTNNESNNKNDKIISNIDNNNNENKDEDDELFAAKQKLSQIDQGKHTKVSIPKSALNFYYDDISMTNGGLTTQQYQEKVLQQQLSSDIEEETNNNDNKVSINNNKQNINRLLNEYEIGDNLTLNTNISNKAYNSFKKQMDKINKKELGTNNNYQLQTKDKKKKKKRNKMNSNDGKRKLCPKEIKIEQLEWNQFLNACYNNCYTNKQNLLLLFYGYIHQQIDDNLYRNIPTEIIKCCIGFTFDETDINKEGEKDIWYSSYNSCATCKFNIYLKGNNIPQCIFGKYTITANTVRQIWRVRINTFNAEPLKFKIGIGTQADRNCREEHQIMIENGLIQDTFMSVMNNDIISIVCSVYKEFDGQLFCYIHFTLNGVSCDTFYSKRIRFAMKQLNWKLMASLYQPIELTIL